MAFLCPADVRLTKKYFLNLIRTHAMLGFDLINEPVFPNDLMKSHPVYQKLD